MQIKITGSSGYLGTVIGSALRNKGHQSSGINHNLLYGNRKNLQEELKTADIVINLAGINIFTRWTRENKKAIYESRVHTTNNLVEAINGLPAGEKPVKVISASAIGLYEPGKTHSEKSSNYANSFIGNLVRDWEKALDHLNSNTTKIIFRMAPVLSAGSHAIKNMILPFKMGAGGKIGSGNQPFPFVHEEDVERAYLWAVENRNENGTFNLVAPQKINNQKFTETLAKKLNRPAFIKVPGFMLKLLYGESAEMLLSSPEPVPEELLKAGFHFKYPDIETTLDEIVNH